MAAVGLLAPLRLPGPRGGLRLGPPASGAFLRCQTSVRYEVTNLNLVDRINAPC
jgi:hypothetical protein